MPPQATLAPPVRTLKLLRTLLRCHCRCCWRRCCWCRCCWCRCCNPPTHNLQHTLAHTQPDLQLHTSPPANDGHSNDGHTAKPQALHICQYKASQAYGKLQRCWLVAEHWQSQGLASQARGGAGIRRLTTAGIGSERSGATQARTHSSLHGKHYWISPHHVPAGIARRAGASAKIGKIVSSVT